MKISNKLILFLSFCAFGITTPNTAKQPRARNTRQQAPINKGLPVKKIVVSKNGSCRAERKALKQRAINKIR